MQEESGAAIRKTKLRYAKTQAGRLSNPAKAGIPARHLLTQILQFKKNIDQNSDANYPGATARRIWSGLTQTLKMKDILSSKIKGKSFIFNRLPKGQKVQLNFLGLILLMAGGRPMAERKRNAERACGFAKENYWDVGEGEARVLS